MLKSNKDIISKINKEFLSKIETAEKPDWVIETKCKNGENNFLFVHMKQTFSAYDSVSPRKEIHDLLKDVTFVKNQVSVIIGCGTGIILNKILNKKDKRHHIILFEPTLFFIKKILETYDLSEWISNGELIIVTNEEDIRMSMNALDSFFVIENWGVLSEKYTSAFFDIYGKGTSLIHEYINQIKCSTGTVMGAGEVIAKNDIKNLPYIIRHPGVKVLKDFYKGMSAVVISTGPSLYKNIHHLKKYQDKIIIIAVAQALRALLAYNTLPDFIISVDYGEVNYDHFNGLMDSGVPFVAFNRTYYKILQEWEGPKFIVASGEEYKGTGLEILQTKGNLMQGGSVSHAAFSFALHLGCKNIAIIGQDLAYENDNSHIPLVDARGKVYEKDGVLRWKITDQRSVLKKNEEKQGYYMSNTVHVPGYFGNYVKTNIGLASFITSFNTMMQYAGDANVYNCTEGGAKIEAMKQKTFIGFLSEFAIEKVNKKTIEKYYGYIKNHKGEIKKTKKALELDIEKLKEIIENAMKGIEAANKIENKEGDLKELLAENTKYSNKAHELTKKQPTLSLSVFKESRLIFSEQYSANGKTENLLKNEKDLEIRIKRNKLILEAVLKKSKELIEDIEEVVTIFTAYLSGFNYIDNKNKYEPSIEDAEEFFKNGNWARPLLEARKILKKNIFNMKAAKVYFQALKKRSIAINKAEELESKENRSKIIKYNDLVIEAQREGREKKNFKLAEELLLKALEIDSERQEARWGYASVLSENGELNIALDYYHDLVCDFPENNQYKYEYGCQMLKKDVDKGLEIIKEVMEKTHEYDYFLYYLGEILKEKKDYEAAIKTFNIYKDKFPEDIKAYKRLAECFEIVGQTKKAKNILIKLERMGV